MSIEDWKKEAKPHRVQVDVCFDRTLLGELETARQKLADESKGMLEPPVELENHVEELRKQVEAKTRTLVFQSIGSTKWKKLTAEHPPTKEQLKGEGSFGTLDHNPETFPFAALAATCIEPGLTEEEARWLADELPLGVFDRILGACYAANIIGGDEKKAVATVAARRSANR